MFLLSELLENVICVSKVYLTISIEVLQIAKEKLELWTKLKLLQKISTDKNASSYIFPMI